MSVAASVTAPRRALVGGLFAASILLLGVPCRGDEAQEFEVAKARIDRGKYDEAAKLFEVLLDPSRPVCGAGVTSGGCRVSDADLIERARGLYVACLVALGAFDAADDQIAKMLRENPAFSPSPAVFPAEVIDRFTMMRGRMREELDILVRERAEKERQRREAEAQSREAERKRVAELERLAGQETLVQTRSRWIAAVPFGVGQIQNDDVALGLVLGGTELAAGVVSIVTAVIVYDYASVDTKETVELPDGTTRLVYDEEAIDQSIRDTKLVNRIAFGTFLGLAVAGVVEAQVSFKPESTTVRKRPVPTAVGPSVSVSDDGVNLGIVGRF